MGLRVICAIEINFDDGTSLARVAREDLTFNAQEGDFYAEADLAVAAATTLTGEALERLDERLKEWAEAVTGMIAEAKRKANE